MESKVKIAVIGGGIAGSSVSLYLGKLGLDVTLFEKNPSLVSGPPICHLHAGGNLYRELSDESCVTLLKESIELLRFYPKAVDYRPTVLAIPKEDKGEPEELFGRLDLLKEAYAKLIKQDSDNRVLCDSCDYYKTYSREEIELLKQQKIVSNPSNFDEWMIVVAKNLNLDKIKFPLILVQEYGLNIFRLGAAVSLQFEAIDNVHLLTNSVVIGITAEPNGYRLTYQNEKQDKEAHFDYLINSAGFRTGSIDDMLGFKRERLVEFKSAYVTEWEDSNDVWPEVVFFGERGTPQGMAQFTPYPNGHFQIHGMTEEITLFKDGLVKSSEHSAQPKLDKKFIDKIDKSWQLADIQSRTNRAIEHIHQFIPTFKEVKVASQPLYGAQQIPGDESSLRTSDVSFENDRYARCEIVKASSVLTMIDLIVDRLVFLNYVESADYGKRDFIYNMEFSEAEITKYAQKLCRTRGYPISLASTNSPKSRC
jgi:hypothetical protein